LGTVGLRRADNLGQHHATGLLRETVSDSIGSFSIPQLPVGIYTVTFEHQGFRKLAFVDVEQVIGRTRTLDTSLNVAGGEERVNVTSASALQTTIAQRAMRSQAARSYR
jgi:hypothetical protein